MVQMKTVFLLGVMITRAFAAHPADTTFEVNTTGSDANGCAFSTASKGATGTDLTYPTPTVTTFTSSLSAVGTTILTDSGAGFSNTMLGDAVNIVGQGLYVITGFTSSSAVTVDATLGTFSTTSGKVGGACASPGYIGGAKVAGNDVWIKAGTYTITSASSNIAGGVVVDSTGGASASNNSVWYGYSSTRGDDGTPPLLQASGIATVSIFKASGSLVYVRNIKVDGASLTAIKDFEFTSSYDKGSLLQAIGFTNRGIDFSVNTAGTLWQSMASGGTVGDSAIVVAFTGYLLEAHDNSVTNAGITMNNGASCSFCLSYRNTGTGGKGFNMASVGSACFSCSSAYNVINYNITGSQGDSTVLIDSISFGVTSANGFKTDQVQDGTQMINCAGESASYTSANLPRNQGFVTIAVSPWTNVSSSANGAADFSLNNTASGGASLRGVGVPGTTPNGSVGYQDIGAIQHQSTSTAVQRSYVSVK